MLNAGTTASIRPTPPMTTFKASPKKVGRKPVTYLDGKEMTDLWKAFKAAEADWLKEGEKYDKAKEKVDALLPPYPEKTGQLDYLQTSLRRLGGALRGRPPGYGEEILLGQLRDELARAKQWWRQRDAIYRKHGLDLLEAEVDHLDGVQDAASNRLIRARTVDPVGIAIKLKYLAEVIGINSHGNASLDHRLLFGAIDALEGGLIAR